MSLREYGISRSCGGGGGVPFLLAANAENSIGHSSRVRYTAVDP